MKLRNVLRLSQPVIALFFLGFANTALAPAQTEPGMGTSPPRMGDWYRPPSIENPNRHTLPPMAIEFAPNAKERRLLAVPREDLEAHASFLREERTGAFRLLTYIPYAPRVVSANSPAIEWRSGFSQYASEYSFVKKKHGHGVNGWGDQRVGWAELRLVRANAAVGRGAESITEFPLLFSTGFMHQSIGMLLQLGDVPLEEVTTSTAGVGELTRLVPPANYAEAVQLSRKIFRGYRANRFQYSMGARANVNTTYVLRSMLNNRVDHLIAFRVVQENELGITILWRELERYPKPRWKISARK